MLVEQGGFCILDVVGAGLLRRQDFVRLMLEEQAC